MLVGYLVPAFPQLSETFVESELRALDELGATTYVCSLYRPPDGLEGPTAQPPDRLAYRPSRWRQAARFVEWFARRPAITISNVVFALRLRSETVLRGAFAAGWAATELRRVGAGHVHAHFALDAAATAAATGRLLGIGSSCTLHAHELYLRNRALCERLGRLDLVVTVCEYNLDQLQERCPGIRRDDVPIVYCGVDPRRFTAAHSPAKGPLRLLSVGRLVAIKGFDVLIDAVAALAARGVDVQCTIVGEGPLRAELTEQIRARGVVDRVTLPGADDPAGVARRLAHADVFVLACRIDAAGNRDSMPVVIKEAMASSVPVVSTRVAGVPEMVDDEVGRLVDANAPDQLAAAIEDLYRAGSDGRAALGAAARRRVEDRFDVVAETRRLLGLFEARASA